MGRKSVFLASAAFVVLAASGEAQTQILPQLTDGGGWRMAIILQNITTTATNVSLSCFLDTANGATVPWSPPFLETGNTQNLLIPAGGTFYLSTSGTASTLSQGWGQVTGVGVVGYVIYTLESYAGRPDQDGLAQATPAATRVLMPYDNTTGYSTGLAVVNPTGAAEGISVNIQTDAGVITHTTLPGVPAGGQIAVVTSQALPATSGSRGMIEFYVTSGTFSIAAFRFNPTLAFTSLPVLSQSGPPVILGGSTGGTIPQFSVINANLTLSSTSSTGAGSISINGVMGNGVTPGGYSSAYFAGEFVTPNYIAFTCFFNNVSLNGQTFVISGPSVGNNCILNVFNANNSVTAGSVTVTLSPGGTPAAGRASGSFSLSGPVVSVSGSLSGTYSAD